MNKKLHPGLIVIERWLKYQLAQGDMPGFQVSIRDRDKLILNKAYGYANLQSKTKYTTHHQGRIASLSKVFTAAIVLWLSSKKIINLNDCLVDLVQEFKIHPDPKFKKIRILDLLTHRSGIIRDSVEHDYWGKKEDFISHAEMICNVLSHRLFYRPGDCTKYSNIGYGLIGLALERVCKEPFDSIIAKFIADINLKLKIKSDYSSQNILSQGYLRQQLSGQKFKMCHNRKTKALSPAAGFCANTESATHFFYKLYLTKTILPKTEYNDLFSIKWPVANSKTDSYGLGTIFSNVNGHDYVGHSGGFPGFTSQTWVEPSVKRTYGFIANISFAKSFNVIRAMAEIMDAVEKTFNKSESIIVSRPMADNFSSTIYVVGKYKALAFPLTGWLPTEEYLVYNRNKNGYFSKKTSGYSSIREPLRFNFKSGQISSVKSGSFNSYPIKN